MKTKAWILLIRDLCDKLFSLFCPRTIETHIDREMFDELATSAKHGVNLICEGRFKAGDKVRLIEYDDDTDDGANPYRANPRRCSGF
jgi:hypothetical protein